MTRRQILAAALLALAIAAWVAFHAETAVPFWSDTHAAEKEAAR